MIIIIDQARQGVTQMKRVIRNLIFILVLLIPSIQAAAREPLAFSAQPMASIPFGPYEDETTPYYSFGGGIELSMRYTMPFSDILFAGPYISSEILSLNNSPSLFSLTSAGLDIGIQLPVDRFEFRLSGVGGYWHGILLDNGDGGSDGNFFAGGRLGADFQLNDFWNVGIGGTYRYHFYPSGVIYHGLCASLLVSLNPRSADPEPKIRLDDIELDPVFPIFYSFYDDNPLGTLRFTNKEKGEIRNITVSYYVDQFMERPKVCARVEALPQDDSIELPLYALFIDNMLNVTEGTKVSSQVTVDYDYYGTDKHFTGAQTLAVHNRNAMTWDDDRKAASFITAKDPEILRFARNVVGEVAKGREYLGTREFRLGLAMVEAVGSYGMSYIIDPATPFKETSAAVRAVDYLQFPVQTLTYKAGDCDDLSILYCALMEALGIKTAFITVPGHIYAAFSLGMTPNDAVAFYYGNQDLIYFDNQTWVPVEITMMDKGFEAAWRKGAQQWQQYAATGEARLYPVAKSWESYPPVGISSGEKDISYGFLDDYFDTYKNAAERTAAVLIGDTEKRLLSLLDENPQDHRIRNRLAVLYAKFGFYDLAETEFKTILDQREMLSARINLANLYFLMGEWELSENNFLTARGMSLGQKAVELGLAKVRYEQGEYVKADEGYRMLAASNPALAEKYSYLSMRRDETNRASGEGSSTDLIWEEEPEQ